MNIPSDEKILGLIEEREPRVTTLEDMCSTIRAWLRAGVSKMDLAAAFLTAMSDDGSRVRMTLTNPKPIKIPKTKKKARK